MKRVILLTLFGLMLTFMVFPQKNNGKVIKLDISNVAVNGGKVYAALYSHEGSYKKREPDYSFTVSPDSETVSYELLLPYGEYAITTYQDANNNGEIDTGLFGIPKEKFGMSQYSGKGYPSNNFNKLKVAVNEATEKISLGLYQL